MENKTLNLTIFSMGLMISGSIIFSTGSIDSMGTTWMGWIISLQKIGIILLIIGIILGGVSLKSSLLDFISWLKTKCQ